MNTNKKSNRLIYLATVLLVLISVLGTFTGCSKETESNEIKYKTFDDFAGTSIGSSLGDDYESLIFDTFHDITHKEYTDFHAALVGLEHRQISAMLTQKPCALAVAAENSELAVFPIVVDTENTSFLFKYGSELTAPVSAIMKQMDEDGTIAALQEKWLDFEGEDPVIDPSLRDTSGRTGGKIRFLIDIAGIVPFGYFDADGQPTGYEVELFLMIAQKLNMDVDIKSMDLVSSMQALKQGKADMLGSNIPYTAERAEEFDFSYPDWVNDIVLLCQKADIMEVEEEEHKNFFQSIADSFYKTFIRDARWKLVLNGLLITLLITFLSGIFGTVVGFFWAIGFRAKKKWISTPLKVISKFLSGVPSIVILLLTYYVVFKSIDIAPLAVSIIAFTVIFGNKIAGMIDGGIASVGKGQWEAATALGLTKKQTYNKVVFPQVIRAILPSYKEAFGGLLESTSIVGYIAIADLTKAVDIIRSRTYEAFFPLIADAAIYFMVSWLIIFIFTKIEIKVDVYNRKRALTRGVNKNVTIKKGISNVEGEKGEEIIRLEHIKKVYPKVTPLVDVNGMIKRGDVIAIVGPSGTGKSTLLRLINRMEDPTEGKIYAFGQDTDSEDYDLVELHKNMGMVFQHFNLFTHLNVIENVMLAPMVVNHMSAQEAYEAGMGLLKTLGVAEKALVYPDELSGGQMQRVAIARAVAMNPQVLLFDEPTSALDPAMVDEVIASMKILAKRGLTMLVVTHEMQLARDISTRLFYMDKGEIYEEGPTEEMFENAKRHRTLAFINRMRVLELTIFSADYDFLAMNKRITVFCDRHEIPHARNEQILRCFEEIVAVNIVPKLETGSKLHVFIDYQSDRKELSMVFNWRGARFEPMVDGDEISVMIIRKSITRDDYRYDDADTRNIFKVVL